MNNYNQADNKHGHCGFRDISRVCCRRGTVTKKESVLQGIIEVFGCMTAALCFLGWTVKI